MLLQGIRVKEKDSELNPCFSLPQASHQSGFCLHFSKGESPWTILLHQYSFRNPLGEMRLYLSLTFHIYTLEFDLYYSTAICHKDSKIIMALLRGCEDDILNMMTVQWRAIVGIRYAICFWMGQLSFSFRNFYAATMGNPKLYDSHEQMNNYALVNRKKNGKRKNFLVDTNFIKSKWSCLLDE